MTKEGEMIVYQSLLANEPDNALARVVRPSCASATLTSHIHEPRTIPATPHPTSGRAYVSRNASNSTSTRGTSPLRKYPAMLHPVLDRFSRQAALFLYFY